MALKKISADETDRTKALLEAIETQAAFTFNPSIRSHEGALVVSLRSSDASTGPVRASLIVLDEETLEVKPGSRVDLTAIGREHDISPVADPKLFTYRGAVWATFNTGYVRTGNDVFVMPVYPDLGEPIRCEIGDRQTIEKNWGFFEGEEGDLRALYLLDPLTILSFGVVRPASGSSSIQGEVVSRIPNAACAGFTIGTQPIRIGDELLVIAHQRVGVRRRRGYFGRAVRLRMAADTVQTSVSGRRLLHDWKTLLGTKPRRNKHLWFATYFAGVDVRADGTAVLSYGINDQRAGAAELPLSEI
jgi:predicted GH43/DUF377 family glycosyl hydrolase